MSKNKEVTALTKSLTEALAGQGIKIGHQQAQHVLAKMLQQENYHVMAAKLKPSKHREPEPAPDQESFFGILVRVNPDYAPDDEDSDAFDAVLGALDFAEIPATLNEGYFSFAPSNGEPPARPPASSQDPSTEDAPKPPRSNLGQPEIDAKRRLAAEAAYEAYDFGEGVTVEAANGWETFSCGTWTRTVFVRLDTDPANAPTRHASLRLDFAYGTADITHCEAVLTNNRAPLGKPGNLPREKASGPRIKAEIHSDDYAHVAEFDAAAWFARASDEEILELHEIEWRGDEEADAVALQLEEQDPEIGRVLDYCRASRTFSSHIGFEVSVDELSAMAWLKAKRPGLWARILCKENEVDLVQAQEPEVAGMWDWLDGRGNACDCSLETEDKAALNAVAVLGLDQ